MPTTTLFFIVSCLLVLACGTVIGMTLWWPVPNRGLTVAAIQERLEREKVCQKTDPSVWPVGWPHEAPEGAMSLAEAHRTMQRHRECSVIGCRRKATAYDALVAAGRMTPDHMRVTADRRRR